MVTSLLSSLPRRVLGASLGAVLGAALVLAPVWAAPAANADTAPVPPEPTTTVAADSLPTVQINGVVWAQLVVGNRVYVTGEFSQARPAGAAAGTNQTARSNILAYDLTTGALVTSWAPTLNAPGLGLAASPDGSRIYVVGEFTSVSGVSRPRIAALNATTGAVITSFNARTNAKVRAVEVSGSTVYVGGIFSTANNVARSRLAAFSAADGSLTTWDPGADAEVFAITAPAGSGKVVVGGRFETLAGAANYGMGAVDATTGGPLPWPANQVIRNAGPYASIYSLRTNGPSVFGTGYTYLVEPGSADDGNFEGTFSVDSATGNINWVTGCRGDTYDAVPLGDVLYSAGHPHDCGMIGGNPQTEPWTFQRAIAQTIGQGPNGAVNQGGRFNGRPAPMNLHWLPTLQSGTYTGQGQAAWSVGGNANYVVLGGEFPRVNGTGQQGLARFAVRTIAPNDEGAQGYADLKPTLVSLAPGSLRVSWTSAWDRDNKRLTYEVLRGASLGSATVIATRTGDSTWWNRPPMAVTDASSPPGSTQTYRIRVTDPLGNVVTSATTTGTVPGGTPGPSTYRDAVTADGALDHWRLGEPDGTTAYDWAGADDVTLDASATRGAEGAVEGNAATTFAGSAAVPGTAATLQTGPNTFSLEAWIRTTSTSGGKIIGFGNSNTGNSGSYDRHVYMTNAGRIVFGNHPGEVRALTSPKAYNDGQWHHIVATLGSGGMTLYVDARRVASRTDTTSAQPYSGYWRIGGDNINGWPSRPSSNAFAGTIDEVAVYPTALTAAQAAQHYVASGRDPGLPVRPADAYGGAVWDAQPELFWRLDETSGTAALDTVSNETGGTYSAGVTLGGAASPAAPAGRSVTLPGGQQTVVSTVQTSNPQVYSLETWFRTTTTSGGRIMGYGNAAAGSTSGNYDRHVYMLDSGQLRYGIWTGSAAIVDTPLAYNDGEWHHVVVTQGPDGQKLYVDGALVGTGSATTPQGYNGYWRLGSDNTWGGASTNNFVGSLDEFAVYPSVLPAATVAQHWTIGSGTSNTPPTASFTSAATDLSASFDASASSDADGTVASYAWTFGDGETGTGPAPTHVYAAAGTYTVTLTVTDDDGATGTVSHPVTVTAPPDPNTPPTAAFGSSVSDLTASFDASGSTDTDGTIATYAWTFGDGETGTGETPAHTYAAAGTYTVTLTVTDDDGATGTVSHTVTVTAPPDPNTPPTAAFTSSAADLAASFDASGSSDPDGTIASYAWTFGDGDTGTGQSPSHTYAAAGTYTVTLTVTDDDGAVGTVSHPVTVTAPGTPAVAADTFSRTTSSGFGSAETGGAWTVTGASVASSVADGSGRVSVPAGRTGTMRLGSVSSPDTDLQHTFWLEQVPTGGGAYLSTTVRGTATGDYRVKLRVMASGQVTSQLIRVVGGTETALTAAATVPGLTYTAGTRVSVRVQATGSAPTTLRAKVWASAGSEPATWLNSVTDATSGLQSAGSVGWVAYTSSSATATVVFRFDDLLAVEP